MNSEENLWEETDFYCKYCGIKLKQEVGYCSEDCKKNDSVWNWTDD